MPSKQLKLHIVALLALIVWSPSTLAADFSIVKRDRESENLILVVGQIINGDDAKFRNLALQHDRAIVVLDSPGGSLRPSLEIGKMIKLRAYETAVLDQRCMSSCALIWLAGEKRYVTAGASIGFHAASRLGDDGTKLTSGVGNALIGAYAKGLGLSDSAIAFITSAENDEIRLLTKAHAERIGILAEILDDKSEAIANHNMAVRYRWARDQNIEAAIRHYRAAAEAGYAGSQNNLGDLYETGTGVPANDKFAIYWYVRAAERGEPTAYFSLSTLLPIGTDDRKILIEAAKFALLAINQLPDGKNKAEARSHFLKLKDRLTSAEISQAFDAAKRWQPLYQETQLMSDTPRN
jgi:hypothetical protein